MAGFVEAPVLLKVGLIVSLLGLLFHIIGLATPYWTSGEQSVAFMGFKTTIKANSGLWQACVEAQSAKTCLDVKNPPGNVMFFKHSKCKLYVNYCLSRDTNILRLLDHQNNTWIASIVTHM